MRHTQRTTPNASAPMLKAAIELAAHTNKIKSAIVTPVAGTVDREIPAKEIPAEGAPLEDLG